MTFDTEAAQAEQAQIQQQLELEQTNSQHYGEMQAETDAVNAQYAAEQEDPRNQEQWGVGGVVKELQSAFMGGIQDTGSSIVTAPERLIDMATGEMQQEMAEGGYDSEWDDWFTNDANPIETRTWWGGLIRSATHFGTMGAAIVAAAPLAGAGATAVGLGRGVTAIGGLMTNQWMRAAAVGAATDIFSKYSQDANGLQILRDRYGFIDTPLTTNDWDHPVVKTFKNVAEGMGIGELANGVFRIMGKGAKHMLPDGSIRDASEEALAKSMARDASIKEQNFEKAQVELIERGPEFGAAKNPGIADPWQGSPTSVENVMEVKRSQKRIRGEWGAEDGSPGSVSRPANLEQAAKTRGLSDVALDDVYKALKSDAGYAENRALLEAGGTTLREQSGDAIEAFHRTGLGREAMDLTPEQYLAEYYQNAMPHFEGTPDAMLEFTTKYVEAADLLTGSLLREIRDLGLVGREIADIADLGDVDGPAKALFDKLITTVSEVNRSKLLQSPEFRAIGQQFGADPKRAQKLQRDYVNQNMSVRVGESIDAFRLAFKVAGADASDDLFKGIFEIVSMNKDIHNLTDFDAYIRKKLKGGEFNGKVKTGVMLKELHRVMINSVLSGPKTPMRAIMGTSSATFLRPMAQVVGGALQLPFTRDVTTLRASLASVNAMRAAIPEAFDIFKTRLNSYWAGDVATIKSRFLETTKGDENWDVFRHWVENSGEATAGDTAAFNIANMARALNDNKYLTYSTKIMAATDDTFGFILGRARGRELAVREALEANTSGRWIDIDPKTLRNAEDRFLSRITDADGNILDQSVEYAKREATLTTDLTGFAKGLNDVFNATPWARPFFLFARTGVNGLALTAKHTPGFNFLVKEWNDIAFANPNNLESLAKYGINTAEDLANAKALQTGRLAIGGAVITMANMHFMNGGLTGNGPTDASKKKVWMDAGYVPRSINIGGVWIGYDSFEPFNQILSAVADVGDHNQLMGEQWTQDQFQKLSLVIAQAATSKSYLSSLQGFVDLFSGKPGQQNRVIAALLNNQVPLAGLRNDIGKLFNPHMRELNSGWGDAIRNRNLLMENFAGDGALPIKHDLLNGKPIRDHDFVTRMWNTVIPVSLNLDQGPGRKLLFDSGFDLKISTYYAPDSTDLSNSPQLRAMFQEYIGEQNIELALNKLADDPRVQQSIAVMNADLAKGNKGFEPMRDYIHNILIKQVFDEARHYAWARMMQDTGVQKLVNEQRSKKIKGQQKLEETTNLLQMNR
tara:strand:+ start:2737 stop:6495 length:3759 start_codon:yes stop_codon:yes gene_type:complete